MAATDQTEPTISRFKKKIKARILSLAAAKFAGWLVATALSVVALLLANYSLNSPAEKLSQYDIQALMHLQRTALLGAINKIVPSQGSSTPIISKDIRDDPYVSGQVAILSGSSANVPANGDLWVVVHNYGVPTPAGDMPSLYFFTPVIQGKDVVKQRWSAPGVYFGGKDSPTTVTNYRVSLYFCESSDSALIFNAISNIARRNAGFTSMPYPSCKQLDSLFVRRRPVKV